MSDRAACKTVLGKLDDMMARVRNMQLDEAGSHQLAKHQDSLLYMKTNIPNDVKRFRALLMEYNKGMDVIDRQYVRLLRLEDALKELEEKHGVGAPPPRYCKDTPTLGDMKTALPVGAQQGDEEDEGQALAQLKQNAAAYKELIEKTERLLVGMGVVEFKERTDLLPSERGRMRVDEKLGLQLRYLANRMRSSHKDTTTRNELGILVDGKLQRLKAEETDGVIVIMVLELNRPNQTNTSSATMSAPNAGRQSPEPETQSDRQINEPPATNVNDQGQAPSGSHEAEGGKDQLAGLSSNPKGPLDDAAEEKTKKTTNPKA
ncbi:hypothetical protein LTR65_010582 [Meristemomyces frigidus]